MPGLVGFCTIIEQNNPRRVVKCMQDLITHHARNVQDELFCDNHVCGTRTYNNIIRKENQPYHHNEIYIWMDGEFFNRDELANNLKITAHTDLELLCALIQQDSSFSTLEQIDGIYAAVVYDSVMQKIHLISDRYGLRHLYWYVHKGSLAWASEIKAMLALPDFKPVIDEEALVEFLHVGYLLENITWFEGVELLPSGTVLTWDLRSQTVQKKRYWWWDRIRPYTGKIDEEEIATELGRLFINAVQCRSLSSEKIGVTLSGGLDSRAILAAMPQPDEPIPAVTFGRGGCLDARIAASVTEVKGADHHFIEISSDNWLTPRIEGIWQTDGELVLMHMHGIEAREHIRNLYQINMNGFSGDLILGGSYLKTKQFLDNTKDIRLAGHVMGCDPGMLNGFIRYSNLGKLDYYLLQNRVRRFTICGTKLHLVTTEQRKPFFDNNLIEFSYSFPDSLRYKSHIYNIMLLKTFPEYYKNIPYQGTGAPISWPSIVVGGVGFSRRIKNKLLQCLQYLGYRYRNPYGYTDYPNWLRQEPARTVFKQILFGRHVIYPNYIDRIMVAEQWDKHLAGHNFAHRLCQYLTFEIWLQQVFEGKLRTAYDLENYS